MLSLLGSLLGFGSSFLPKVMDYFQDRQDKAHELKLIVAQTEAQVSLQASKNEATVIDATIREVEALQKSQTSMAGKAGGFILKLSASIRPVVTYLFVAEFLVINWAIAFLLIRQEGVNIETLQLILDEEFMTLLATMLSFWFGNRTFGKRKV